MPYLVITIEGRQPHREVLERPTIIGRAHDADIQIPDTRLSRHHCRIEPYENGWLVIDLSSLNGTTLQGQKISSHALKDGDEVIVGRSRIVFHERMQPPNRPATPVAQSSDQVRLATDSEAGLPSPGDTLMDSRFPLPRVDPAGADKSGSRMGSQPINDGTGRARTPAKPPLAFQRPPATPQVEHPHVKEGFVQSIVRLLFRRKR